MMQETASKSTITCVKGDTTNSLTCQSTPVSSFLMKAQVKAPEKPTFHCIILAQTESVM